MINSIGIIIVLCNHDIILKQDKKKKFGYSEGGALQCPKPTYLVLFSGFWS